MLTPFEKAEIGRKRASDRMTAHAALQHLLKIDETLRENQRDNRRHALALMQGIDIGITLKELSEAIATNESLLRKVDEAIWKVASEFEECE